MPADIPLPGLEESERLVSEGTREVPDVSYERRRRTIERELEAHRRRGHYPFDVRCESCRMNKSVTRHPRKTLKQGHEVQADFFFLHGHKFLALKESDSGAVGVTAASGEAAIREIKVFLGFLGLDGVPGAADRPLCIVTDAEAAVGALLKQVPASRNFRILQAAPQSHESVGGGERAVRVLKEGYLTLAADLGRRNVQLGSEAESAVRTVLRHVAMCYNIHGRGSASPLQLILGEKACVPQSAVFSSVCFAEVPEALQEKAEDQRYLPSAYLHPEVNGLGHRVSTRLADGSVVTFTATSVKFLKETLFQPDFCPELIFWRDDQAQGQVELPAERDAVEVPAQPMKPGFHNPPVQWYRDHGPTDGCYACEGLRRGSGTKGRVHSAKCKARYHDWVQAQRRSLEEGVPQGDEVGRLPMDVDDEPGEALSDGYEPTIGRDGFDIMDEDFDFANPGDPSEEEPMQTERYVEVFTSSPQEDVLGAMPRELGIQEHQGLSEGILAPLYVQKEFSAKEVENYQLGGRQVYLLPPSKATTEEHQPLDIEKTVKGRRRELDAMNNLDFGKVVSAEEARQFAETHGLKIIPSRWVLGEKIIEDQPEVRARMVVQEVAHAGAGTAASLGMSSCTPSGEAVRILLSLCSTEQLSMLGLDISTAFLHTPLKGRKAIIRLPSDVSLTKSTYSPAFAILTKAMNGLRIAAKAWNEHLADILLQEQVFQSQTEPCVFAGSGVCIIVYVDDVLIGGTTMQDTQRIRDRLTRTLKVKTTGVIDDKGGKLVFLGREIVRVEKILKMRIPPGYLDDVYEMYGISKGTDTPPDFLKECQGESPVLTGDAATRYRSALGKIAWFCQTRFDMSRFVSILAQGQKEPTQAHEGALRKFIRFLRHEEDKFQVFPVESARPTPGVVAVSDASWAPGEDRRSVTGFALYFKGSCVKAASRMQSCVALSSCEAEIIATAQATQEAIGLRHLCEFTSKFSETKGSGIQGIDLQKVEFDHPGGELVSQSTQGTYQPIKLFTDSTSGRAVLVNSGLGRRVRHMSIGVEFLQNLTATGQLEITWIPTALCVADLLTKILAKALFQRHQAVLGFKRFEDVKSWIYEPEAQGIFAGYTISQIRDTALQGELNRLMAGCHKGVRYLVIEMCTKEKSGFFETVQHQDLTGLKEVMLLQVTKDLDICKTAGVLALFCETIQEQFGTKILAWESPPCTGGSPALFLTPEPRRSVLVESHLALFKKILKGCEKGTSVCKWKALELSNACSYWRQAFLINHQQRQGLPFQGKWDRCAYAAGNEVQAKHSYRIATNWQIEPTRGCDCHEHLAFSEQNVERLGAYPVEMTLEFLKGWQEAILRGE